MSEDKKKTWQVTLPYDDVRDMEARSELLEEIGNQLTLLKDNYGRVDLDVEIEKLIKLAREYG